MDYLMYTFYLKDTLTIWFFSFIERLFQAKCIKSVVNKKSTILKYKIDSSFIYNGTTYIHYLILIHSY